MVRQLLTPRRGLTRACSVRWHFNSSTKCWESFLRSACLWLMVCLGSGAKGSASPVRLCFPSVVNWCHKNKKLSPAPWKLVLLLKSCMKRFMETLVALVARTTLAQAYWQPFVVCISCCAVFKWCLLGLVQRHISCQPPNGLRSGGNKGLLWRKAGGMFVVKVSIVSGFYVLMLTAFPGGNRIPISLGTLIKSLSNPL